MCSECKKSDFSRLYSILDETGTDGGSLITVLQRVQKAYGYLPKDVLYETAEKLSLSPAQVMGVATFYSQFRLSPVGKNLIMLCKGTACHVNGSDGIEAAVTKELGIKDGETTRDGLFSLKTVACLGCCSLSPVMMINGKVFGSLTPEKAVGIIKKIREDANV